MSNTGKTKSYITAVDDETYACWQNEIARLKPRKRKNWKGSLKDKWGQRTKVIYNIRTALFTTGQLSLVDGLKFGQKRKYPRS